ncbi:putative Midasin [Seiridium cardinale]
MATVDVSSHWRYLLADEQLLRSLPAELSQVVRDCAATNLLDAVAAAALLPQASNQIFVYFENIFADVCARWLLRPRTEGQNDLVIAAFARILPFAPYLSVFLEQYLGETSALSQGNSAQKFRINSLNTPHILELQSQDLEPTLIAVWRLLSFDKRTYSQLVQPSQVQALFEHQAQSVRYLAIRVFCQLLSASDAKLEALISKHITIDDVSGYDYELQVRASRDAEERGTALVGEFDGQRKDYTFLSLDEQNRAAGIENLRRELKVAADTEPIEKFALQSLTPLVVRFGTALLPRPQGNPESLSTLVHTSTTLSNLEGLSLSLQQPGPILLHGLPGSGKTSVVNELARELGMDSTMVTLHLNEQTDAKMLIGLYSTDSKPGSFSWRPGVLTTAVREGRWVLIEDLDRAPNEVMSTLLPLVERGELLIPSRGETVIAPSSFRLFATVRTTRGMHGQESLPTLLGQRFWDSVAVKMPMPIELQEVIIGTYPLLPKYAPDIISVYNRLASLPSRSIAGAGRGISDRSITPRDLLKWCRRLNDLLVAAGCKTGEEPISETTRDWIFLEAVDCFCGSIPSLEARATLVGSIAQQMHLPPQRVEHYLQAYVPQLEETPTSLRIGRTSLGRRVRGNRIAKSKKPFASTSHAKRLLEQIAVAVRLREPTLLVGETGIGKTTVVQQLAETLGHKLVAVNLSQQSEVGDLLGGFKPVNVRTLAVPLKEEFEDLFASTGISADKNQKYLESIGKCIAKGQWTRVSKLWREAPKMFRKILADLEKRASLADGTEGEERPPVKRRKTESKLQSLRDLRTRWDAFDKGLDQFDVQISGGSGSFAFAFIEGNIVKAARNGDWVLLDEINLASPDTLESIADLLVSGPNDEPSILLSETGEIERVKVHPDFRIFGAMNPATDIGKRDLPLGLRSRFTELYVSSPDKDLKDLLIIIKAYLKGNSAKDDQAADDIARLYLKTKELAEQKKLVDGANEVPHFSLRTLTRVLSYVNDIAPFYGLRRALYEGFSMGFLTLLSRDSEDALTPEIRRHLLDKRGNARSILSQPPKHPNDGKQYVRFQNNDKDRHYWLLQGSEAPRERTDYIITKSIERNLLNLVRATSTRRFPVLIQGPTSSGKTSMIEFLANFTGNKFVRINNHEHTDLQEYLGTYVSGADGKLRFQEGLLVQALREGHWIVLDELNLAPTDVLEALNRLLDDNRELLIPETQEVVRPHENFMLFATQNPPGLYGGRKVLSRAFRNRFLELHFDDIPENELQTILEKRSLGTAPSDCKRIVEVYKELARLRQSSRLFENKDSFATLRDLFRWALRGAAIRTPTAPGALPREEIANHGFMLLAERVRDEEERIAVKEVIEKVFKVKIEPQNLYDVNTSPYLVRLKSKQNAQGVVWTNAMRRLYVLVAQALENSEPVLLVGETGCGKTTVCQLLAEALGKELHIVNAHQNTETGDLIGSQRPVRNRAAVAETLQQDLVKAFALLDQTVVGEVGELLQLFHALDTTQTARVPVDLQQKILANEIKSRALFEWSDGSLVQAMKNGQYFLLDEISLADDSVLERLNSVLEPSRTLLLAEKGIDNSFVKASDDFKFFATMNPGGDFGKKELSPALRNRFTEIWVPPLSGDEDILQIVRSKLKSELQGAAQAIVRFSYWFGQKFRSTAASAFSIRDILVWVKFINESTTMTPAAAVIHGAATVFIDTLGANPSALIALDPKSMDTQRQQCLDQLTELLGTDATSIYRAPLELIVEEQQLRIGDFAIGRAANADFDTGFALHAPTTKLNAMRVIRALQVQKPILLEGSPGVGKTTLVGALAKACGQPLTRINLSDQTDLMDLFGTDVPIEGAEAGNFAWRDAPFLRAMQNGEWVLLDEMNLASQSVLEGLNACLDHRGEVYISELDQTFQRHPNFRLFAAQNPHHQGGGRKGLPSSFVNRFIVVYADVFSEDDLFLIAQHNFPEVSAETVKHLIKFISTLDEKVVVERSFGAQGAPWEFNLRDTLRWLHLLTSDDSLLATGQVDDFLDIIIRQRFRNAKDRQYVNDLFTEAFHAPPRDHQLFHNRTAQVVQIGLALLQRDQLIKPTPFPCIDHVARLPEIESVLICIKQNLPCILAGPSGSGKSALLQHVAALSGKALVIFPMNADIDTMDLVGGFEQRDPLREVNVALRQLRESLQESILDGLPQSAPKAAIDLLNLLEKVDNRNDNSSHALNTIKTLRGQTSPDSRLAGLLSRAQSLLSRPTGIRDPTFEWLDGIIVHALQKGQWLVLDNANLCSASVLDRLNGLLEPNGSLIINEHCGPDGEPRVIQPHPDFRIFLTMDPRYGELSRAMRNRAIEIHIDHHTSSRLGHLGRMAEIESSLSRLELLNTAVSIDAISDSQIAPYVAENLSTIDMRLLVKYQSNFRGLATDNEVDREFNLKRLNKQSTALDPLVSFAKSASGTTAIMANALYGLYLPLSNTVSPMFGDVQPLHSLQNTVVLPLLTGHETGLSPWLAICYEIYVDILKARSTATSEVDRIRTDNLGLSSHNRFQRSCKAGQVPDFAKDSTADSAKFLLGTLDALETYIRDQLSTPGDWNERMHFLKGLMQFWWRIFNQLSDKTMKANFDEAAFQAHLRLGTESLTKFLSDTQDTVTKELGLYILQGLTESFVAGFKLNTGLSMEPLWTAFKPMAITNHELCNRIFTMETLARQFDQLKWDNRASLTELAQVTTLLANTYRLIRDDASQSDNILDAVLQQLKKLSSESKHHLITRPFMTDVFEYMRQVTTLEALANGQNLGPDLNEALLLSDLPILAHLQLQSSTSTSQALQYAGYLMGPKNLKYLGEDNDAEFPHPWAESLSIRLISRLDTMNTIKLQALHMLEAELPVLAKQIANCSGPVTDDPLDKLGDGLETLIRSLVEALGPDISAELGQVQKSLLKSLGESSVKFTKSGLVYDGVNTHDFTAKVPNHVSELMSRHLVPALVSLWAATNGVHPKRAHLANAWVQFSLCLVKLFVPDKIYDPQLKPLVEAQSYEEQLQLLLERLDSLKKFALFSTGQSTNLRCQMVQNEIGRLGAKPQLLNAVHRSPGGFRSDDLRELQGHFNNLLKVVLDVDIPDVLARHCFGEEDASQQLQVVRQNIAMLLNRMAWRSNSEYEDLRTPALNIVHCLEIGLSLSEGATAHHSSQQSPSSSLLGLAPFVGGAVYSSFRNRANMDGMSLLSYLSTIVSLEGIQSLDGTMRELLSRTINSFYDSWSQKLEADRKAEEQKKSLYRYRGGFEEEEAKEQEDFQELFPDFDAENELGASSNPAKIGDARTLAINLAQVHREIFLTPREASESIKDLCKLAVRKASGDNAKNTSDRTLLAAALLALDDSVSNLETNTTPEAYNFYVDPNLAEIDEIGHMQPLVDVIEACDNVLELSHTEPLAKIIISVEKLHGHVYEWQHGGWAPKIYGALTPYNNLTAIIVSWRRLELSTWGKLFDMEVKKCEDDANAWWFVAYQAVIAGPMALVQSGDDLSSHVVDLLKSLEMYFSTAVVGQFVARLALMRQLLKQLDMLLLDWPAMSAIRDAVYNFVSFYAHFEKAVQETIQRGRAPIEKQMKDVLLLASWKDTNIVALRESARKSHQKLFRIIRKLRDVLGQPMQAIIASGLPDETHQDPVANLTHGEAPVNKTAVSVCQQNVPEWKTEYKRLANISRTVEIMTNLGKLPSSRVDAVGDISSFLLDLESSAAELRKETPPFLTDENKNQVKHLKSRKRKLFAEILREVREMGFKYNLGTDALAQQDSLAAVLSATAPISSTLTSDAQSTEYYFHKILDLAPRFRSAAQTHNEDLTGAEVNRSIGFLEGMMQSIVNQRRVVSVTARSIDDLATRITQVEALAISQTGTNVKRELRLSNASKISAWIVQLLPVGIHLIELHGKFGAIDNKPVASVLKSQAEVLSAFRAKWDSSASLPVGLTSQERLEAEDEFSRLLNQLSEELQTQSEARPDLAFVLEQLQLWTTIDAHHVELTVPDQNAQHELLASVKKLGDSILVAVEQYNKSTANIPTSSEDPGWLVNYDKAVATSIKALHVDKIIKSIQTLLGTFSSVDLENEKVNRLATCLVTVVHPIIRQYQSICQSTLSTYRHLNHGVSKMAYSLSKSFVQLAGQGFCTPQEKSDETSGDSGKLESGTGLGEGEGAEDISKDIQPEEDLSELAQEKNKDSKEGEELEDEKDAVDMADEDLEGEMGSVAGEDDDDEKGSKSGDEEDGQKDLDEETGDVDDLDPNAVDEKMWDGQNEEDADKDQKGDKPKGQQKPDEQMAADQKPDENDSQNGDGDQQGDDEENDELGAEQDENVQFEEMNHQDQNVQDQDTLALPDDMDIDGNDQDDMSSISDDDLDKLSDVHEEGSHEPDDLSDGGSERGDEDTMNLPAEEETADAQTEQQDEDNANIQEDGEMELDPELDDRDKTEDQTKNDAETSDANVAPSDVRNGGQDENADQTDEQNQESLHENAAQREGGEMGESAADQDMSSGNKGNVSQSQEQTADGEMDDAKDSTTSQPFKALGDALEKFYRQQREIKESQKDETPSQQPNLNRHEEEMASREFQHLQDDDDAMADAQAIGTATEDEARPFDDTMAIDDETQNPDSRIQPEDEDELAGEAAEDKKMDTSEPLDSTDRQNSKPDEPRTGVSTRQGAYDRDETPPLEGVEREMQEEEEDVQETSVQLESTHLSAPAYELRDFDESMQQWTTFQSKTNPLSLSLTSQLRLILTPSQSTKLSGSFRTGKRLNIKRIIPYIASSYKRDKIWMRRAIPTKRSYQILLCVDDSKSMGESSSGTLALESLVMVSRALAMLEVGQVGVLGFGANAFMAHEFTEPFTSHDAGAKILQKFSFNQDHTDISLLIRETIARFRTARLQNPGRGSEDLWQLALILSDGLTPSDKHDEIRRLLREAHEERIMIVFIVMDDTTTHKRDSVLNLRKVQFMKDDLGHTTGEMRMEYYLDSFPFRYYLIVHNLEDLPGALAGLLRSWFAEVNA